MRITPEPAFSLPGFGFEPGQRRIMQCVRPVPPGQSGPHGFLIQTPAIRQEHLAHQAAVAVGVTNQNSHLLLERQGGRELPGSGAEGLPALWGTGRGWTCLRYVTIAARAVGSRQASFAWVVVCRNTDVLQG
jgi:hypothetical protein